MDSLHTIVLQGKVLYLVRLRVYLLSLFSPKIITISSLQGISDSPAWVVAKANQYAKDHGKTPFCIYQGNWSVLERSFERDIIPMARSEGLALAPWGVLEGGKIRTNAEEARRKESGEKGRTILGPNWERNPDEKKVCDVLEEIAKEVNTESITSGWSCHDVVFLSVGRDKRFSVRIDAKLHFFLLAVAIAYHLHKVPYVFPIIGGRKVEQLQQNLEALDISLTPEQVQRIENAVPFSLGFPHNVLVRTIPR
jgi:aryl-alcohol dehydrogenase-like predicted oxidoreductase